MALTIEDIKKCTTLYDGLKDRIDAISKNQSMLSNLVRAIRFVNDKNSSVLNTAIVGPSLLINENDQAKVMSAIGLRKSESIELCRKSPRLQSYSGGSSDDGNDDGGSGGVGKIVDQFAFALPLLLLAGRLHAAGEEQLAQGVFLFCYYRPYASKVTTFFRLGTVDETAMEYTVNIELNDKSYIHKYGSVYNVLVQSAKSAYDRYVDELGAKGGKKPTDDLIYNNVFYSAIFSKTGSWLKSLYGTYKSVKASGKALAYEKSFYTVDDDDSGDVSVEDNNIQSDSAAKRQRVSRALTKFSISPIDRKLIAQAAAYGCGSASKAYESFLIQAIDAIAESKTDVLPGYFDAIVGAFIDSYDSAGKKNSADEIPTLKFLAYSRKIFKTSHTLNANIREEQNLTEELLVSCAPKYSTCETKTKRKMKLAMYMYFVIYIQKA